MVDMFFWVIALLVVVASISIFLWSFKNGISPMPTSPAVLRVLLENLPKNVSGPIVDLGAGWGSVAIPLARAYRHCHVIGYETSPVPYFFSTLRKLVYQCNNLDLLFSDLSEADLTDVDLVYCYLYPEAMSKLKSKFQKELPPGALIITNTFSIPSWTEEKVHYTNDLYHTPLYFYKIPMRKEVPIVTSKNRLNPR